MGRYFGTDGIRGKANEGLTAERAFVVGRYLGYYYSKTGKQKKEKQIADMFIHRVTAHFRQDLSKAYHGFPGKSNKAGGCGADGAGDSCNLTRLRVS